MVHIKKKKKKGQPKERDFYPLIPVYYKSSKILSLWLFQNHCISSHGIPYWDIKEPLGQKARHKEEVRYIWRPLVVTAITRTKRWWEFINWHKVVQPNPTHKFGNLHMAGSICSMRTRKLLFHSCFRFHSSR